MYHIDVFRQVLFVAKFFPTILPIAHEFFLAMTQPVTIQAPSPICGVATIREITFESASARVTHLLIEKIKNSKIKNQIKIKVVE